MAWIQSQLTEAFGYLSGDANAKYVRNVYKVRLAIKDMLAGFKCHNHVISGRRGQAALTELLTEIAIQVRKEVVNSIPRSGKPYTIEQATEAVQDIWGFASYGMVFEKPLNLSYDNYILVEEGSVTKPKSLANTGFKSEAATCMGLTAAGGGLFATLEETETLGSIVGFFLSKLLTFW